MEQKEHLFDDYVSPLVARIDIATECGFAFSDGNFSDDLGDNDYGEEFN